MPISALAAKALPALLDNAPAIWAAANQLIQSARKAKAEIPVEAAAGTDAAISDIEASLLALNAQMEKSGALVVALAEQNAALAARVEALERQARMLWLTAISGLAIAVIAIAPTLGR